MPASPRRAERRSRRKVADLADFIGPALFALVLIFGGANDRNPIQMVGLQLASLPVLLIGLARSSADRLRLARTPLALLAAAFALPLLQLVPLPPPVWTRLPGRAPIVELLAAAGLADSWRPLSLSPAQTVSGLLYLLPPAAVFVSVLSSPSKIGRWMSVVVLAVAALSLMIGVLQIASPLAEQLYFYHRGEGAVGVFPNRNHQAAFLLSAIPLSVGWALSTPEGGARRWRLYGALAFSGVMLAGLLSVQSRAGILLAGPAVLGAAALIAWAERRRNPRRALAIIGATAAAAVAIGAVLPLTRFLDRFAEPITTESRVQTLPTVFGLTRDFGWVGGGLGSFPGLFERAEPLEIVEPTYLNHAHNDFLELWIDGGAPALIMVALLIVWLVQRTVGVVRSSDRSPTNLLALAGSVVVVVLLIHSTVDYPLRTPALAGVLALCVALLGQPPAERVRLQTVRPGAPAS